MRYIALALSLCSSFILAPAPLEAGTRNPRSANTRVVKVKAKAKKNKVNGRKAPKRQRTRNRVN